MHEIENGAYAHTQFEQCNARFDQLHCDSLESVSVRSLVECKQIYGHVYVCVSFSAAFKKLPLIIRVR